MIEFRHYYRCIFGLLRASGVMLDLNNLVYEFGTELKRPLNQIRYSTTQTMPTR